MRREIRFRGKDIKTGEWIEGFYAPLHIAMTDNHDKVTGFKEIPSIFNDESGERSKGGYWHTVDPNTVGQYVGTKDKTGKRVYEGDIVDAWSAGSHTTHGLIKWGIDGFFISRCGKYGPLAPWKLGPSSIPSEDLKDSSLTVIGNVIDNPELLPCEDEWKKF